MKVNSLTVLHYGVDYLSYSLRAISPLVNQSLIFYTPHPSHGHSSNLPPIETRDELMASIPVDEWSKLTWVDTEAFWYEGQQRDYALKVASENADLVLTMDYDEVWNPEVLEKTLDYIWRQNKARNWLLNFSHHLWRSFNWACQDDGWPVRVIDTRHNRGLAYIPKELGNVYHLGYAIPSRVMEYKLSIHGHKDELRPNWLEEKWQAWPPVEDCHPTNGRKENGEGWWNPKPFDKWQLPEVMYSHPFFNLERID